MREILVEVSTKKKYAIVYVNGMLYAIKFFYHPKIFNFILTKPVISNLAPQKAVLL